MEEHLKLETRERGKFRVFFNFTGHKGNDETWNKASLNLKGTFLHIRIGYVTLPMKLSSLSADLLSLHRLKDSRRTGKSIT